MTNKMDAVIERERQLRITAREYGISENALIIWRFLAGYMESHGYPPSYTEMVDECFLTKTAIGLSLDRLEDKGYIKRPDKHRSRAVQLLQRPPMPQEATR